MKKILLVVVLHTLAFKCGYSQEIRFNTELDKTCKILISEFKTIPEERKITLDNIAQELAKKKYILFTCKTNSRRTLMLQVWAQTSFYYYGVFDKYAFSTGDTITDVYPGVIKVLKKSGFYCSHQKNSSPSKYVIAMNNDYPFNLLSSKDEVGTVDTSKGVVINICVAEEPSSVAAAKGNINLPYQSPTLFESTSKEGKVYRKLNHKISLEMFYLADKTKDILTRLPNGPAY